MPHLSLHPGAAASIDTHGAHLITLIKPFKEPPERPYQFHPDRVPTDTITEANVIGTVRMQNIDFYSNQPTSIVFEGASGPVGIVGPDYAAFSGATALIRKHLRGLSRATIQSLVVGWLEVRSKGGDGELSRFLIEQGKKKVAVHSIWIPIANLLMEADVDFGPVTFRVITREILDSWFEPFLAHSPPERLEDTRRVLNARRQKLQGLTAVVLETEAERDSAVDECFDLAEDAVALLRIVHPANSSPHMALYCGPLGTEHIDSYDAYVYAGGTFAGRNGKMLPPPPTQLIMPNEVIAAEEPMFARLSRLLAAESLTQFQEAVRAALLTYSRNSITRDPSEKLLFVTVGLESMLLRNQSEPIGGNIAERVAFAIRRTADERQELVRLMRAGYDLRSTFVHHGRPATDLETVGRFMQAAWEFMLHLLLHIDDFQSKDAFIDSLERLKFE